MIPEQAILFRCTNGPARCTRQRAGPSVSVFGWGGRTAHRAGGHTVRHGVLGKEILVQHTGLDAGVVLVLAGVVLLIVALDGVVIDLTDLHVGIDDDGVDAEHLQGPVAGEAHVAKAGGDVDEQPQPAHRGTALQHGDEPVGFGVFQGAAQIELVGLQQQAALGDDQTLDGVVLLHVQGVGVIDQQLVGQAQVVAVGVELGRAERFDDDVSAQIFFDLLAGQQHGGPSLT